MTTIEVVQALHLADPMCGNVGMFNCEARHRRRAGRLPDALRLALVEAAKAEHGWPTTITMDGANRLQRVLAGQAPR